MTSLSFSAYRVTFVVLAIFASTASVVKVTKDYVQGNMFAAMETCRSRVQIRVVVTNVFVARIDFFTLILREFKTLSFTHSPKWVMESKMRDWKDFPSPILY